MRYALVNTTTHKVDNIVEWDGDLNVWQPPEGYEAIYTEDKTSIRWQWNAEIKDYEQNETIGGVQIGETWDGTKFVEVDKPEPPPQPEESKE
jgi:hypothetical protein